MATDFHFQEWAFLAQIDAQAFERRRRQLLAQFLRDCGHRRPQLERLQRTIDQQRRTAETPEAAVAAISQLMCTSFCTLLEEVAGLSEEVRKLHGLTPTQQVNFSDLGAAGGHTLAAHCAMGETVSGGTAH